MNVRNHPDTEQLSAYVHNPESKDSGDVALHLATCAECRSLIHAMEVMQSNLSEVEYNAVSQSIAQDESLKQALEQQTIERYLDGQLSSDEGQDIEQLLQSNNHALKAALHYVSHSSAMARHDETTSGDDVSTTDRVKQHTPSESKFSLGTMLKQLFNFQAPAWIVAPVAAALVLVVNLVSVPLKMAGDDQLIVAQYQDNPVIRFSSQEQAPGIGFFADANTITKPYDPVITKIEADKHVRLAWNDIEGADAYTIQLHIFKNGQRNKVLNLTTKDTHVRFKRVEHDIGQRYEWDLSGITIEGKKFQASGGFVIQSLEE